MVRCLVAAVCMATLSCLAGDDWADTASVHDFLAAVRRPFQQDAWGRFSGTVVGVGAEKKVKAPLDVAIVFSADSVKARLLLDETNEYHIEQAHAGEEDDGRALTLQRPEKETGVSLFDLGLSAEDVTFAFIYWKFKRELERESVRRQACRVIELQHPETDDVVRVWFSIAYLFPLRVCWYHKGEQEHWRELDVKGVKKHDDGLWFLKTVQLRGDDWKTQVKLKDAELFQADDKPVPPDLLKPKTP